MSFTTNPAANRDTFVRSDRTKSNFGGAASLRAKSDARIYLGFDIDKPADAHLVSAVLQLWTVGTWTGAVAETVDIRQLTDKWGEGKATWNDKPAATETGKLSAVAVGATGASQLFQVDVTALVGLGSAWRGLDVRGNNATDGRQFRSSENGEKTQVPRLLLTWVEDPTEPVNLSPSDGRIVGTPNPWLDWDWVSTTEDLQQAQVQVDDATDFASPVFDSGYFAATESTYRLIGYNLPASAVRYWRVRVKTETGAESPWSEPAQLTYVALPTLTMTSPAEPFSTLTPDVTWTFAGQTKAQVKVYDPVVDKTKPLWTSDWLSTALTVQVPPNLIRKFQQYRFDIAAWDGQNREASAGQPDYAASSVLRTFSLSAAISPPLTLTVTFPDPQQPMARLTWTRGSVPDEYSIFVDDVEVATVLGSLTTYDLWLVRPNKTVTIKVAAGMGDPSQLSLTNPSWTGKVPCIGAWLYDPVVGDSLQILDEGEQVYGHSDDLNWHNPVGRQFPVVVRSTTRGLEGSVDGTVMSLAQRDQLVAMWKRNQTFRLIIGDINMGVRIGAPTIDFDPQSTYQVRVPVIQVSD